MNKYFNYDNIEYWDEAKWKDKISSIFNLVTWIGAHNKLENGVYDKPVNGLYGMDCRKLDCYYYKTNSVNDPEVINYWKSRGVHYEYRAQGGVNWLIMAPTKCFDDYSKKIKTLVVFHNADKTDPYWALKTLEIYKSYNDMVAEKQDIAVIYLVNEQPDFNRIYVNILQEAYVFVPGDTKQVYLDVSTVYKTGHKLSEIDFVYKDDNGNVIDPDSAVQIMEPIGIPVLDISGRWENRCSLSRDQVSKENWSSKSFELDRVIHSETGRKFAEGMALEYKYDTVEDPGFIEYFKNMGLYYESCETQHRRWKAVLPMSALEEKDKKLPVICVLQEVNCANDHLAVTEASYFLEYFRIAAQGECILINFVLEDPDGNDLLVDILKEAMEKYPIDPTRVYVAGHSHNGIYTLEFATRHPNLVAAIATFGDPPGFQDNSHIPITPDKAELMRSIDMPTINLVGYTEANLHFPLNADGADYRPWQGKGPMPVTAEERIKSWQLRLYASNCPNRTAEEMLATKDSDEKAIRMLGIPGDKAETLWLDGFELYIVDIKNNNGKYHLRMVAEENMPHNTSPAQQVLSWSFMRRFARDLETGKTIELY